MFGFGKTKKTAHELATLYLKESLGSLNGFMHFIARKDPEFYENDNKSRLFEFLNEKGFDVKERTLFAFAYTLFSAKIFLRTFKIDDDGLKIYSSCLEILDETAQESNMKINMLTVNDNIDKIINSNTNYLNNGELFKKEDHYDVNSLYYQVTQYLIENYLDKEKIAYAVCKEYENESHISLCNCLNITHRVSVYIFKKFKVLL